MFKTAIRAQVFTPRQVRTSQWSRRKAKVSLELPEHQSIDEYLASHGHTTNARLDRTGQSGSGRGTVFRSFRTIDDVQNDLECSFGQQMNEYLRGKIKALTRTKQKEVLYDEYKLQNPQELKGRPPLAQYYTLVQKELPLHVKRVVQEAYVINAKQKITRLLGLKSEKEKGFSQLQKKINIRVHEKKDFILNKKEIQPNQTIEDESWDKEWREEGKRQVKRYRNRLLMKWKRNEGSPFIKY